MNESPIDFFDDQLISGDDLPEDRNERLLVLVDRMIAKKAEVDDLSVKFAEAQEEYKYLEREAIPQLMEELGQEQIKMTDGRGVKIQQKYNASVRNEDKPTFYQWLKENDADGIIKTKLQVEFDRDEIEEAQAAAALLVEEGYLPDLNQSIHAQTLTSFAKERLENGEDIPTCLNVYPYKVTKITLPKSKK